jgi:hypothetical protein
LADGSNKVINTTVGSNPDGYAYSSNCSPTGYYLKKYWDKNYRNTVGYSSLNTILIRYADVLLMNAEANAEAGTLTEAVWNATIRPLRVRAGYTDAGSAFPAGQSNDQLIRIVRNERRCELAFEGLGMQDLYRWKTADAALNGWCHGMYTGETANADNGYVRIEQRQFDAAKHYLWSIPQTDRDINHNLTQNPAWN